VHCASDPWVILYTNLELAGNADTFIVEEALTLGRTVSTSDD